MWKEHWQHACCQKMRKCLVFRTGYQIPNVWYVLICFQLKTNKSDWVRDKSDRCNSFYFHRFSENSAPSVSQHVKFYYPLIGGVSACERSRTKESIWNTEFDWILIDMLIVMSIFRQYLFEIYGPTTLVRWHKTACIVVCCQHDFTLIISERGVSYIGSKRTA